MDSIIKNMHKRNEIFVIIESTSIIFEGYMFIYFLKFIYVQYFFSFVKIFGKKILDHFDLKRMKKRAPNQVSLNLQFLFDIINT